MRTKCVVSCKTKYFQDDVPAHNYVPPQWGPYTERKTSVLKHRDRVNRNGTRRYNKTTAPNIKLRLPHIQELPSTSTLRRIIKTKPYGYSYNKILGSTKLYRITRRDLSQNIMGKPNLYINICDIWSMVTWRTRDHFKGPLWIIMWTILLR